MLAGDDVPSSNILFDNVEQGERRGGGGGTPSRPMNCYPKHAPQSILAIRGRITGMFQFYRHLTTGTRH